MYYVKVLVPIPEQPSWAVGKIMQVSARSYNEILSDPKLRAKFEPQPVKIATPSLSTNTLDYLIDTLAHTAEQQVTQTIEQELSQVVADIAPAVKPVEDVIDIVNNPVNAVVSELFHLIDPKIKSPIDDLINPK